MSDFKRGVMCAVGLALFGKGMYELGRHKAQREEAKRWHVFKVTVEEICKSKDKKKKEES